MSTRLKIGFDGEPPITATFADRSVEIDNFSASRG
jgi:hypothetical protein